MPISVLIADDTALMREAIARLLSREPNIELVGEAINFAQTLRLTTALKPDLLLLDLHMPDQRQYPPDPYLTRHEASGLVDGLRRPYNSIRIRATKVTHKTVILVTDVTVLAE